MDWKVVPTILARPHAGAARCQGRGTRRENGALRGYQVRAWYALLI